MCLNKQMTLLLLIVFLGFLGMALPYPILAALFLSNESLFILKLKQQQIDQYLLLGVTLAAYPFAQFLGAPILGSLSDRLGRKKILVFSTLCASLGYVFTGLAINQNSFLGLIIFRAWTGLAEGNIAIAQASISDSQSNKTKGFGAVSASAALGYVIGPFLGGLLCDNTIHPQLDYAIPFYVAGILALIIGLIVIVYFKNPKQPPQFKQISMLDEINVFKKVWRLKSDATLRNAFIFFILLSVSIDCYYEFYPALLVEKWHMHPAKIGTLNVLLSIALSIGAFYIPLLMQRLKNIAHYRAHLLYIFILSLCILLISQTLMGLVMHFTLLGLSYSAVHTIQSVVLSDQAPADKQGEIMGLLSGLRMLADGVICIFGSLLLARSHHYPLYLSVFFAIFALINLSAQKLVLIRDN